MKFKHRVTVYAWLVWFSMFTVWACGIILGFTLGAARADTCSGWSGRWFSTSQCTDGGGCTTVSFGPFWQTQCTPPPQQYPVVP